MESNNKGSKMKNITADDVIKEADRNYDLGRKHAKGECQETIDLLVAILREIDKMTCSCPCMSRQAQQEFERCKEADGYKAQLAGVIIEIREKSRLAIGRASSGDESNRPRTQFCLSCGATHQKEICPECGSDAQDNL